MQFESVIIWLMAIGIVIGGIDRLIGNRLGLGEQFEEGFNAMGPLALGMVGIVTLAPVIAKLLGPVIIPTFVFIGADPAMFASILANDMGGYPLAMELARDPDAGLLSGLIVSSMMGCTLVFSIPVGLGLIQASDRPYFSKGLLIGLITVPFGGIAGGLIAGFDPIMVIKNNIPVLILSAFLVTGLLFFQKGMIKGAILFGKFIVIVITIGLLTAAFQELTNVVIIPNMTPIMEAMEIIATIAIVLLGVFPIVTLITKFLKRPLTLFGKKLGMDATAAAGIVITMANSIPVYKMMKDMEPRGKIINTAWLVPATAVLGDHLGFTAAVAPEMIKPVVLGKLAAGILAVVLALLFTKESSYKR
ncbi:MAG: ethanolamine utilization protein EutH [Bacteroidota bacterium]